MPGKAAQVEDLTNTLAELMEEARQFAPAAKGEANMRRWLADLDLASMSQFSQMCVMADATLLTSELLISQPSASGATAFDRMAKRPGRRPAQADAALAALRLSRFALLAITGDLPDGDIAAKDIISGDTVRLAAGSLPPDLAGTSLFGRLVAMGGGRSVIAGVPTPLDAAGLAVATNHVGSRLRGAAAGARWAEAIFTHVVRYGTLDIPGVNRPRDMGSYREDDEDLGGVENEELVIVARAWAALDGGPPDDILLRRSRALCDTNAIISAVLAVAQPASARLPGLVPGLERLLLVQLETVARREQVGSGTVTLDGLAAEIDNIIAQMRLPSQVRDTFQDYRERVTSRTAKSGVEDAELSRLLQRIRGLRAKTVDQGCTEQEALAAAEKVAELLDRYGLSLSEVDFSAQPCDGAAVQTNRRRMGPLDTCVPTIASFFDCRVWSERPNGGAMRYMFFGLRADVVAALYLYGLVERAFETETGVFRSGPIYADMAGERRSATTSFQTGLAMGIRNKLDTLRAARAARQSSGRDLVVMKAAIVDEEVAKLGLEFHAKSHGGSSRRLLNDAFVAGKDAAERFEWTPGIERAA